jgi:hypothetical protein
VGTGNVVVIGAGPAGLAAAHAADGLGFKVRILAPFAKTPQRGPLLMQRPLPGINTDHPDGYVRQTVIGGSILGYRYKLYGDINIAINGDILQPGYHAWRMQSTYDRLWARYSHLIEDSYLSPYHVKKLDEGDDDLVVCTAPAPSICRNREEHQFNSMPVKITPETQIPDQANNTIIFNADPEVGWVRSSLVFGSPGTEWPVQQAPSDAITIKKPLSHSCTCHPRVLRTGRFGKWQNETWVDTAYYDVRNALVNL